MSEKISKSNEPYFNNDYDSTQLIPNKTIIERSSYDTMHEAVGTDSTSQLDINLMLGSGNNSSDINKK